MTDRREPRTAIVAGYRGDYAAARSLFEESLARLRELGDKWGIALSLSGLGELARRHGDDEVATTLQKESLALFRALGTRAHIATCLEWLARTAVRRQPERASRLLGAAAALREAIGAPLPPVERAEHERVVAEIRTAQGEDRFAVAWAAGRALAMEQAIAEGLGEAGASSDLER